MDIGVLETGDMIWIGTLASTPAFEIGMTIEIGKPAKLSEI